MINFVDILPLLAVHHFVTVHTHLVGLQVLLHVVDLDLGGAGHAQHPVVVCRVVAEHSVVMLHGACYGATSEMDKMITTAAITHL